jgi:flagellar L-ring protein precursor FlgH
VKLLSLICFCSLLLVGCGSTPEPPVQANDPRFAPIIPDYPVEHIVENGTLFQARFSNSLFSDLRARRVGDIITVQLNENTNASKSADTQTLKEQTLGVDPIIGFGNVPIALGGDSIQLDLESENEFRGNAQSNQSNNLQGNISVTVVDVLPNQNLVIRGEKWITLNNGDEYIRLTGIIRPADISPQNVIQSTQIANARIQYSGTGSFARAQEKGWLAKFFDSKWWPL